MDRLRLDITGEELKIIEHGDILMASRMDRQWWSLPERRFPDARSRDIAIETGRLVHVVVPNQYFTSPSDIRNDPYLQLLRPGANNLLFQVCKELDMAVDYSRSGFRLAVTSMYRSDELQREIINSEEWYRAAKVGSSAHGAGAAFDISIRSHYAINQSTRLLEAVNSWNESFSLKYQPVIFEILGSILSEHAEKGKCNLIVENLVQGSEYVPTCFHVCISPSLVDDIM